MTTQYEFYNGYTRESMNEAEVKTLLSTKGDTSKLTVKRIMGSTVLVTIHKHVESTACQCYKCTPRPLYDLAYSIKADWNPVWFGAVPYLQTFYSLDNCKDTYGCEDGKTQVIYFLANAQTWKGIVAKSIKAELKYMSK